MQINEYKNVLMLYKGFFFQNIIQLFKNLILASILYKIMWKIFILRLTLLSLNYYEALLYL